MDFSHCKLSGERLDEVGLVWGNKVFFVPSLGPGVNWFWKLRQHPVDSELPFATWKLVRNYDAGLDSKRSRIQ